MPINKNDLKQNNINYQDTNKPKQEKLLEFLRLNYPSTIKDETPNINEIARILGLANQNSNLGYELNFTGKPIANALYSTPTNKALSLNKNKSTKVDAKDQIIIGDNLDALKLLSSAYYEKIKLIYIDPPYNTGNDGFIYPDDFRSDYKQILRDVGLIEIDEDGKEKESELIKSFKNITGSKSHSGWLSFMLPRLKLARDLLRDDGAIFISIDDNEQANLKILCDEIFGEENFIANFIWKKKGGASNTEKIIGCLTEYILCYAKNKKAGILNYNKITRNYKYKDEISEYNLSSIEKTNLGAYERKTMLYPIIDPNSNKEYLPSKNKRWTISKETIQNLIKENKIYFDEKKEKPFIIMRPSDYEKSENLFYNLLLDFGSLATAKNILEKIFNKENREIFDTPKPVELIKHILQLCTSPNNNDIILDFFAGSGTTAQAVIEQNKEDGGNRKFILVQLDEKIDENKSKAAFDFCKNELHSQTPKISDITCERVRRIGGEFSIYKLKNKPNIKNENGTLSLNLSELSPLDRARNIALFVGISLDTKLFEVIKNELYLANDCYFLVCANSQALLKIQNGKKVYLDGFCDFSLSDVLNLKQSNEIEFIY